MNSYSRSEKSRGILAFANNTPDVDYESIARKTLALAEHSLGLPSYLVTGQQFNNWHNRRTDVDTKQSVAWNNFGRYQAYELSPWDETLVIDIDLLIVTDRLLKLFDTTQDYILCHTNNFIVEETTVTPRFNTVWATMFMFRKTPTAENFFSMVGRVQRNWNYYRTLFGIVEPAFRNDHAFAMAEKILNGGVAPAHTRMPFQLTTMDASVNAVNINQDWMVIRHATRADILPRTDLHVMSKHWLQSTALDDFLEQAHA